ncbi:MAG: TylF/MycF/NovP-related O-methyltransferase [Fibrobacteria bacterium]
MQPLITMIRVRNDGIPAHSDSPIHSRYRTEFGPDAQIIEMPFPAYHTAREFALDFLAAIAIARGAWIQVVSGNVAPRPGDLSGILRRLSESSSSGVQGAVLAARVKSEGGLETGLFEDGFSLDAMETAKSAHPWLADPSALMPFFVMSRSFASSLAEEFVRTPDPSAAVICFVAASKVETQVRQGAFLEFREATLIVNAPPAPNAIADQAMADFEADRSLDALKALDYIRFTWGASPSLDLHRSVLSAKLERFWLATHTTRRFLQNNKGSDPAKKLFEALKTRRSEAASGYAAAAPLLDLIDPEGDSGGEKWLFDFVSGQHEQSVGLVIGDYPLRAAFCMLLACLGTPRKVVTLSPFRSAGGWKGRSGRGYDVWKSMVSRFDLEDHAEASVSIRERLAAWGDAPRPDILFVALTEGNDYRDELAAAFALLKEGGLLVAQGATAEHPQAWKFWIESAEPALSDKGREGALSWGRKTSVALGGSQPVITHAELLRRCKLPEPFERTMLSNERFRNAFNLARFVDIRKLPGSIVECGVWKGGCSSSMLLAIQQTGSDRALWAFDSFEGLPRPGEKDGAWAFEKSDEWGGKGCEATEADFRETLFKIAGLKDRNVHIRKGWFKDTLPIAKHEIGPISILRLDGDWYDSVLIGLECLYDLVVPGGYILIDDYGYWEGAQKATDEFRARLGIQSPLILTDHDERYWIKIDEKQSWKPVQPVRDMAFGVGTEKGGSPSNH